MNAHNSVKDSTSKLKVAVAEYERYFKVCMENYNSYLTLLKEADKVEKKIEYTKPVIEYAKPFRKVYFGFYEDQEPPKVDFVMEPSELWDN